MVRGSGGSLRGHRRDQSGSARHSFDGRLHMRRLDGLSAAAGGLDPGSPAKQTQTAGQPATGAGQQVEGGWFDDLTVNAHRREALLDVWSHQGRGPGTQAQDRLFLWSSRFLTDFLGHPGARRTGRIVCWCRRLPAQLNFSPEIFSANACSHGGSGGIVTVRPFSSCFQSSFPL